AIVTVVCGTISWYYLIGPIVFDRQSPLLSVVISSLYPTFDVLLIACLFAIWNRSDSPGIRVALEILSVALIMTVVCDSVFQYQQIQGTYRTGTLLDDGWVVSLLLMALAALVLLTEAGRSDGGAMQRNADSRDSFRVAILWLEYAPYVTLPVMAGLLLKLWYASGPGDDYLVPGVVIACILFVALIMLRQLAAIHENHRLQRALREESLALEAINRDGRASNQAMARANRRLESLVTSDPLTNLPNHRGIMTTFDREVERAHRFGRNFSVLFIDLDHFKTINDTYGHAAGDTLLKEFAGVIRISLRGVDVLGRWGGEEFLTILPEIDVDGAAACAERIRESVASFRFSVGGGSHLTCSIGIASYPAHADERGQLIDLADRAMYAAKHLGRNQVRLADEPAVAALRQRPNVVSGREETTLVGVVEALAAIVQARDLYTGDHTVEVGRHVSQLALKLGLGAGEAHMLGLAGLLRNIGKVGIPDAILQKPSNLTADEWKLLHEHPIIGADMINRIPALRTLVPIIRGHHERWDGRGYPDGLVGESIPLGARIVAVVDAYFAITSDRPYKGHQSRAWAFDELRRCSERQFDPTLVSAFVELLESHEMSAERPVDASALAGSIAVRHLTASQD
ncbi:MAG TPA: diguanylate cyclase, partial [Nitrolancea sp.]|nr:diguanylate cyclase [Nitrolancea sp.]